MTTAAAVAAAPAPRRPAQQPGFVQDEQQPQQRPDREDCPERDGNGGSGSGSGSGSESEGAGTTAPSL